MHVALLAGGSQLQSVSVVVYLSTQGEEAGSIGTDLGLSEIKSLNPFNSHK